MSTAIKVSLMTLISTAAAIPQYGHGHSKYHNLKASQPYGTGSGRPAYPTGGWSGGYNSTRVPHATGTGAYGDDKTTTLASTITSTQVVHSTIYATSSSAAPVVVEDVSTGATQCGLTVTVTASEKVTVTVAPSASASSACASAGVSSVASVESDYSYGVPASSYEVPTSSYVIVSSTPSAASSVVEEVTSSKAVEATSSKAVEYVVPTSSVISLEQKPVAAASSVVSSAALSASSTVVSSAALSASSTVVSSATPSATGSSPSYTGTKRGLAYNDASLCKSLEGSYGFAYNWAQVENNDIGTTFIPMMHKPSDSTAEAWLANVDKAVQAGGKAVMGFNEPDHADQANLTPDAACTAWKEYMNPIASSHADVTIIGPSVTNGAAPMGLDWLDRFHTACPDAIVHATNIHFYDVPSDETIDRFKAQIEKAASAYSKPVWVTEFGLNTGSATDEQAASFLKQAMEYMDSSDLVQGYSYFMVADGANMLNANTLVGQAYAASTY